MCLGGTSVAVVLYRMSELVLSFSLFSVSKTEWIK